MLYSAFRVTGKRPKQGGHKRKTCSRDGERVGYFEGPPRKRMHCAEEEEEEEEEGPQEEQEEEEEEEEEKEEEEQEEQEEEQEGEQGEQEQEEQEEENITPILWMKGPPPIPTHEVVTKILELANLSSDDQQSIQNLLDMIRKSPPTLVPACGEDLTLHSLIKKCRSNAGSGHYVSFISMLDYIKLTFHLAK